MLEDAGRDNTRPTANAWQKKAWKQRRDEILRVRDKCEWCGVTQEQSLQKYHKGLTIDHVRYGASGLSQWRRVAWELYQEQPGAEPRRGIREPKAFKQFKKSHKAKIDKKYKRGKEDPFARYKVHYQPTSCTDLRIPI